jgi:uncharacterized protein
MRVVLRLALILAALALMSVACQQNEEIANPASEFCEEQGGTVEIATDDAGNQSGICRLSDGTEIDEWEYYRRYHVDEGAGLANPAAVFCEEQGGVVSGDEPMCELPDGSVVDAWEYFRSESGLED